MRGGGRTDLGYFPWFYVRATLAGLEIGWEVQARSMSEVYCPTASVAPGDSGEDGYQRARAPASCSGVDFVDRGVLKRPANAEVLSEPRDAYDGMRHSGLNAAERVAEISGQQRFEGVAERFHHGSSEVRRPAL
jgi:hypothetical protein